MRVTRENCGWAAGGQGERLPSLYLLDGGKQLKKARKSNGNAKRVAGFISIATCRLPEIDGWRCSLYKQSK